MIQKGTISIWQSENQTIYFFLAHYRFLYYHFFLFRPGSTSVNLIEQAKTLVRVLNNPRDRKRWKVVTIWMGHNDVCTHPCNTSYTAFDASPQPYMRRLARALDVLRDNLPNTFVNLLPVLDITIATEM